MPITKKSNIRSRWYRPNEKPLESSKQVENIQPLGEISTDGNSKLVDDLSAIKPYSVESKVGRKNRSSGKTPSRKNKGEYNKKVKSRPKENESENGDKNKKKGARTKYKHKRNGQSRESDEPKSKVKNIKKTNSKNRDKNEPDKRESHMVNSSKLSSFIAKIFGN